jgi:hypothetical protein
MTQIDPSPSTRRAARALEGRRRGERRRGGGARRAALAVVPLALLGSGALVYQASNAAFTASTSTGTNSWTAGNVMVSNTTSGSTSISISNLKPGFAATASNAQSKCVQVSYAGNLAANVRMYVSAFNSVARPGSGAGSISGMAAGSEKLEDYLRVAIEEGTGANSDCTDFTASGKYLTTANASASTGGELFKTFKTGYAAFPTLPAGYDGNATTWAVSGPATRTFKVTYWLPDMGETGAPTLAGSFATPQARFDDLQGSALSATLTWEAQNS